MRMPIKEIELALNSIKIVLEHTEKGYYPEQFKTHEECLKEVMDIARKYQKIAELYDYWRSGKCEYTISCMENIGKVLRDGKID